MRILAFDPGHKTGVAVIDFDDRLEQIKSVFYDVIDTKNEEPDLYHYFQEWRPDHVVIEWYPQFFADATTVRIANGLRQLAVFERIPTTIVLPGEWKPFRDVKMQEIKNINLPKHARDAWWMAYYVISKLMRSV